jgi:hypothetical protein
VKAWTKPKKANVAKAWPKPNKKVYVAKESAEATRLKKVNGAATKPKKANVAATKLNLKPKKVNVVKENVAVQACNGCTSTPSINLGL